MELDLGTMAVRWIVAAALAAGCGYAAEPVRFTERKLERKVAGCEVDFQWLEATSGPAEVRRRINAAIVEAFFKDTPGGNFQKEADDFVATCRKDRYLIVFSLDIWVKAVHTSAPVLSFEFGTESYTGQPHAYHALWYLNLDPETGKPVKLESMLVEGALARLTEIAERHFREERELSPTADLKEAGFEREDGHFHLNENYGFGEKSLTFFYNEYEIAPYSMGSTDVEIPYGEILELLRPGFRKGLSAR
jgi:Protein of unknown function (DUF3298)